MTNRSSFPNAIDQFQELSNLLASDKTNVDRYQSLLMKSNRTSEEETELTNLKNTLVNKLVNAEHFNKLQDCITNLEDYFLNRVMADLAALDVGALRADLGTLSNLTTTDKTNVVSAVNEVQSEVNSANDGVSNLTDSISDHISKKNNPHSVTASQVGAYSKAETDSTFAKKEQEAMFSVPLIGGAIASEGRGIRVFKDSLGLVHVNIDVDLPSNTTVAWHVGTLPVGYRPAVKVTQNINALNTAFDVGLGELTIGTDGTIVFGTPQKSSWRYFHINIPPYKTA